MKSFEAIIGYETEKEQLMQICDMATSPAKYAALGVNLPRGVLLHGVPGVGKTLMATALIEEMGRRCFTVRKDKANGEFVDYIAGVFAEAKENAPSVIFLDDMDKFAADSDRRNPEEYVAIQTGIDDVRGTDVFVVATANNIHEITRSLLRAGRFDRVIEVKTPNRAEAVKIVGHYIEGKAIAADVTPVLVARLMDGNSCAELEGVLNEAGIYAGFEGESKICRRHIIRAVLRKLFDAEESINEMSAAEREEVVFHEAGHAVVAYAFDKESVSLISIRPSKSDSSGVVQILQSEGYFGSYRQMYQRALSILAGRAAVEIKYGRVDVGSASDLRRANAIIQRFIKDYCVSGFTYFENHGTYRTVSSDRNDDEIVAESNAMLGRMYEEAKGILRENWDRVELLAAELVKRDTLLYEDISELFGDAA